MKFTSMLLVTLLPLPVWAQEQPAPEPTVTAPIIPQEAIQKVEDLIKANAELQRVEDSLRSQGVKPIKIDGGLLLAFPTAGEDPSRFLKQVSDKLQTNLGGYLVGTETNPTNGGNQSANLTAEMFHLKLENQTLKEEKARLLNQLTKANTQIDWLQEMLLSKFPNLNSNRNKQPPESR